MRPVKKSLRDAKLDKSEIHQIVLAGGSTLIPLVQQQLREFFGADKLTTLIDPEEIVCRGAGMQT